MVKLECVTCGGNLILEEGSQTAVCESCGRRQSIIKEDDAKKTMLFVRANRMRASCEFDRAAGVYETLVTNYPDESLAYWGLVLCKYGIEYVDDPKDKRKVPTCHRSSFDSVLDDDNYHKALEHADVVARDIYKQEAQEIERLRRDIIEVSSREEPYDIFICYKENDENGERTLDSVLGQDLYDQFTAKGYRVFFARITLEEKLGQQYEPYIFAALNSAKVMLVIGTDTTYVEAPWVRNEWSRFLQLMAAGQKKTLIPCYKNINPYDLPQEFSKLQAQDLGKIGATQDLLRGVDKICGRLNQSPAASVQPARNDQKAPLLRRAYIFLADGDFKNAAKYANRVLDTDPENAHAYICQLLASIQIRTENEGAIVCAPQILRTYPDFRKAVQYADPAFKQQLLKCENQQKESFYDRAKDDIRLAVSEKQKQELANRFQALSGYKDSDEQAAVLTSQARTLREQRQKAEEEAREKERRYKLELAAQAEAKRQEEQRKKEEAKKRAQEEAHERELEERNRQEQQKLEEQRRQEQQELEALQRRKAAQARVSRGYAVHTVLFLALFAWERFGSTFRALLEANDGSTWTTVLVFLIFTLVQGVVMRIHKTGAVMCGIMPCGGIAYGIVLMVMTVRFGLDEVRFGFILAGAFLCAICAAIGSIIGVFRKGMD